MSHPRPLTYGLLAVILGTACGGKIPFPEGLAPLESNRADWPTEGQERISTAFGTEEERDDGYTWGHARGYVQQPVSAVYSALTRPRVSANRRSLADYSVERDVEDYPHSYRLHNTVEDLLTFEFSITWRHGSLDGDEDDPEEVGSRWQKTDGSDVIELQRGSVYTWAVDDDTTALEVVLHQRSLGDDRDIVETYLADYYADILAASHGDSLPEYATGL